MRAILFLALAALAAAEPSQSEVHIGSEPQDGDVHNRVKRELMGDPDGFGPKINVDMEINAGPNARVDVDVDVNIGQTSSPAPDTSPSAPGTSTPGPGTSTLGPGISTTAPTLNTTAAPACDYAAFTSDHSMLKPPSCTNTKPAVTEAEKTEILNAHNTFRAKVASGNETLGDPGPQPNGANIRELKWNDELARVAQALVNQCSFNHDCSNCRKICSRDYTVGQNLYYSFTSRDNDDAIEWTQAIQAWYNEVSDMPNTFVASFSSVPPSGKAIGHYTQVVWAETYEVGCGAVHYADSGTKKIYACNYGPAGNFLGSPVYVEGAAASQCPGAVSTTYTDLCA